MTENEIPILRPCPRCGQMRMSTKANRFHRRCRTENAKLARLAQGATALLSERAEDEEDSDG